MIGRRAGRTSRRRSSRRSSRRRASARTSSIEPRITQALEGKRRCPADGVRGSCGVREVDGDPVLVRDAGRRADVGDARPARRRPDASVDLHRHRRRTDPARARPAGAATARGPGRSGRARRGRAVDHPRATTEAGDPGARRSPRRDGPRLPRDDRSRPPATCPTTFACSSAPGSIRPSRSRGCAPRNNSRRCERATWHSRWTRRTTLLVEQGGLDADIGPGCGAGRADAGLARHARARPASGCGTSTIRPSAVSRFGGEQRFVADYLSTEVLAALDEERRGFLQGIAVLGQFTPALCDAALDRTGSDADDRRSRTQRASSCRGSSRATGSGSTRSSPNMRSSSWRRPIPVRPTRIHHNAARWLARRRPIDAMAHAIRRGRAGHGRRAAGGAPPQPDPEWRRSHAAALGSHLAGRRLDRVPGGCGRRRRSRRC